MCDDDEIAEKDKCVICGKKLRPLIRNIDSENRRTHITCWNTLIKDIANFETTAYTKYGYKKMVAGMTIEEAKKQKTFTITFD